MRQTRRLVPVLLVILAATTCGRNELSIPTSPSATTPLPSRFFDTADTPALSALSITPSVFRGGEQTRGTITLSAAAPAGGTTVTLTADDTAATVPASIVIAEGATIGTFTITTKAIPAEVRIGVTATAGGRSLTALMRLTPGTPLTLSVDPIRINGGDSATGTVKIKSPAPAGGAVVRLASEGGDAIVPASITIAQGTRTGTFTIETRDVSRDTEVWITATEGGDTGSVQIRIVPKRGTSGGSGNGTVSIGGVVN